jgi:hypothetical protein
MQKHRDDDERTRDTVVLFILLLILCGIFGAGLYVVRLARG